MGTGAGWLAGGVGAGVTGALALTPGVFIAVAITAELPGWADDVAGFPPVLVEVAVGLYGSVMGAMPVLLFGEPAHLDAELRHLDAELGVLAAELGVLVPKEGNLAL